MIKLLKKNITTLISFEILYSFFINLIVVTLVKLLFSLSLKISGIPFLSQDKLITYFFNPFVILIILLVLLIITYVFIYNIFALNYLFIYSKANTSINLKTLIIVTYIKSKIILQKKSVFLVLYISIIIPYAGIIYKNPLINELNIPNFILNTIYENPLQLIVFISFSLCLTIISLLNIYTFHYMFNNNCKFIIGMQYSIKLLFKTFLKLGFRIIKLFIFLLFAFILKDIIYSILIDLTLIFKTSIYYIIYTGIIIFIMLVIKTFFDIIAKVLYINTISSVFFEYQEMPVLPQNNYKNINLHKSIILITLCVILLFTFSLAINLDLTPNDLKLSTYVMAHRGSSIEELENTLPAFKQAMKDNIEYIELDVTLSSDNEVIIIHDLNLNRLANINLNVKQLTLKELKKISIYSSDKTKKEEIMTLKELIKQTNINTSLNIELKPAKGDAKKLAEKVEEIIKYQPRHIICSLNYDALKTIKQINPSRITCFVIAVALGDFSSLKYADSFSIEESFVNSSVVETIHNLGKKVFVWTVNDLENVVKYYQMGVDAIITDYPKECKKQIYELFMDGKRNSLRFLFMDDTFE